MYESLKELFLSDSICEPATFYWYKITIKLTMHIYLFYDAVLITRTSLFYSKYVPLNLEPLSQSNNFSSFLPIICQSPI